ncbi:hypothetical protein HK096_008606 [Nowakowskiella sp. JEL0078]|nr:hypothetical protein HK096_008606 [Nowakowskiella sp. JEL0078]
MRSRRPESAGASVPVPSTPAASSAYAPLLSPKKPLVLRTLIPRTTILALYRDLISHTRNISMSNKSFILSRLRREFRANEDVVDPVLQRKLYQRGVNFLKNSFGGIL